jgi:hypothetical protein
LRKFKREYKKASDKEIERFDEYFLYNAGPWFDRIAKEEGLTPKQRQRFLDIMYRLLFVKGGIDERYDNVLIGEAIAMAKRKRKK